MTATVPSNPFHAGEREAHARAGVGDVAKWAGGFIRDFLPEQHRDFHTSLPFLVVSGGDENGQTWITLLEGEDGFVTSPNPRRLELTQPLRAGDPLAQTFAAGADIGVVGIELATRRRNRFSGRVSQCGNGYAIDIRQTFGNCPQYIHERDWTRVTDDAPGEITHATALSDAQISRIGVADTMFIGSGQQGEPGAASTGYDASHRGGAPGFVHVVDATHLQIPDYAGNNFFNTIGNLIADPRVGLLFVDFETGGLLHISGRATIEWDPRDAHDEDAWRVINVEIDAVIDRPKASQFRWSKRTQDARRLKLTQRVKESETIVSLYFKAADGRALEPFSAGQHLPIKVQVPGRTGTHKRTYSLSSAPDNTSHYRLSIKREDHGVVSTFLHDNLRVGRLVDTETPSGDFVIPDGTSPLVLVSAGIGLTPMLSMLNASALQARRVWYVHGARDGENHAFKDEVSALVAAHDHLSQRVFYSRPTASDRLGQDYDAKGRISADSLLSLNAGQDAHYMLCGPVAFLADLRMGLEAGGVAPNQIHFETFGPTGNVT